MIFLIYKLFRKLHQICNKIFSVFFTYFLFIANRVKFSNFTSYGIPYLHISKDAKGFFIGSNFRMNNNHLNNPIGYFNRCTFVVHPYAEIQIGKNVGISQSAIISHCSVFIGDNVDIGGGCVIYTSDFHSLDWRIRITNEDQSNKKNAPVVIKDNVFIGARSIILKGVVIGENSIVGAGSVVTRSIPANQIWAGNPARFIRNIK